MCQIRKKLEGLVSIAFTFVIVLGMLLASCSESANVEPVDESSLNISGVSIPSSITASRGEEVTITGKGFKVDDIMMMILSSDSETEYVSAIIAVTENSASFLLPDDITTETYKLKVSRADEQLTLGSTNINVSVDTSIPDIDGMTVKGGVC